jgi:hypothetical protein
MNYVKPNRLSLTGHPQLNEKWVQEIISSDPSVLGLGDLVLKDKERIQPHAGRLDLLCQDIDSNHRYEIEIQLGKTDESHLVRTIEYWDIERKRYPQYDHTAVIVAETITSRFLNIISLFNGFIPLVAIQMQALELNGNLTLVFTTVLSEMQLGLVDEDEEVQEVTDRSYWERRGSKATMEITDSLLTMVRTLDPALSLKYNKFYIGLAKDGQARNFLIFRPKKEWVRLEAKLERSEELESKLENAGLDLMEYDTRWSYYRVRLNADDVRKHKDILRELMLRAHREAGLN